MRDQKFRAAVDCGLEDHIVRWIGRLRAPPKMRLHRLAERGELRKRGKNLRSAHPVDGALFLTLQHVFVFEKQSGRNERREPPRGDHLENRETGSISAAKG